MDSDDLLELLPVNEGVSCSNCLKQIFTTLRQIKNHEVTFKHIGEIDSKYRDNCRDYMKEKINPWSEDSPIGLNYYPYCMAKVYKCPKCKALFLIYKEEQGHSAFFQGRWIRRELSITS